MTRAPGAVTLQVWRIPARRVPAAVLASQLLVQRLRRRRDVSFAKVLGTASSAFLPSAITPRRWAALTCWQEAPATLVTWFDRHADERASLALQPLSSRGSWDGRQPFGELTADSAPADLAPGDTAPAGP